MLFPVKFPQLQELAMKAIAVVPALLALLLATACDSTGQQQAVDGKLQMPGERPAPAVGLNIPPDAWSGPSRPEASFASSR